MLYLAILRQIKGKETTVAVSRGEALKLSQDAFRANLIREVQDCLPKEGGVFKRKNWDIEEINRAVDKSVDKVFSELKRKTIRM